MLVVVVFSKSFGQTPTFMLVLELCHDSLRRGADVQALVVLSMCSYKVLLPTCHRFVIACVTIDVEKNGFVLYTLTHPYSLYIVRMYSTHWRHTLVHNFKEFANGQTTV